MEVRKSPVNDDVDASDDSADDASEEEEEQVAQLVTNREKRSTQGNRYASLLAQEADQEDELGLLFQEDGVDDEFEGSDDDASDAADESDSDEEEDAQGPGAAAQDNLAGERELEKEQRAAKKAGKRKAMTALSRPAASLKRVKIVEPALVEGGPIPPTNRTPQPKPRPIASGKIRASSRAQTIQNKERTLAHMEEMEKRRQSQLAAMQASQKRKAASKAPPMTQAQRLLEAARTEKINNKSVSRWEAMETKRKARQKERLDALHDRKLEGPLIRWRSTKAMWVDGRLQDGQENVAVAIDEDDQSMKGPPEPAAERQARPVPGYSAVDEKRSTEPTSVISTTDQNLQAVESSSACSPPIIIQVDSLTPSATNTELVEPPSTVAQDDVPDSMPDSVPAGASSELQKDQSAQVEQADPPTSDQTAATPILGAPSCISTDADISSSPMMQTEDPGATLLAQSQQPNPHSTDAPAAHPRAPAMVEVSTRNTITLLNYSEAAIREPAIQRRVLLGTPLPSGLTTSTRINKSATRALNALQKPAQPLCAITAQPARYRDPRTGLPYAGLDAYRTIGKLLRSGCVWSDLLGAWVGPAGAAALGVPPAFRQALPGGGGTAPGVKQESSAR